MSLVSLFSTTLEKLDQAKAGNIFSIKPLHLHRQGDRAKVVSPLLLEFSDLHKLLFKTLANPQMGNLWRALKVAMLYLL